jgi:hypothetical protein
MHGPGHPVLSLPLVETKALIQGVLVEGLNAPRPLKPLHHPRFLQSESDLPNISSPSFHLTFQKIMSSGLLLYDPILHALLFISIIVLTLFCMRQIPTLCVFRISQIQT